jgi:hypothetical protein
MADSRLDSSSDNGVRPGRGSPPATPRWVKVSGLIAIIVLVVFVVAHLTGLVGTGGHH